MRDTQFGCDAQRLAVGEVVRKRWVQFGPVHCALDFNLANVTLVETSQGYVAIDAGPSLETAQEIRDQFAQRASGDPLAIIFTHSHADHIRGAPVFHERGVEIWAHAKFADELAVQHKLTNAYVRRAAKQFGTGLPADCVPHNGIGPRLDLGADTASPILYPTHTFRSSQTLEYGGLGFQLFAAPGETHDHLFVWIPELRTLHAGDNFYSAFPNLYSIRGVSPRPVEGWIASLDRMRRLSPAPEVLVLGHTEPIVGADRIHQTLTDYRDAIAFVHDSVVRGLNADVSLDDMLQRIELPARLQGRDFLQQRYGTVRGAVRGIHDAYMGWFDGQAAHLDPISRRELVDRLLPRLGGRDGVITAMRSAIDRNDLRWAVWLGEHLMLLHGRDRSVRAVYAEALRRQAEAEPNPLMRSWGLSDAAELSGGYQAPKMPRPTAEAIADMPIESLLAVLPSRVDPASSAKIDLILGFKFSDSAKQFTFHIRRGVGEMAPTLDPAAQLVVRTSEADFKRALIAKDVAPLSREFLRVLQFEDADGRPVRPFRGLLHLARFARSMVKA